MKKSLLLAGLLLVLVAPMAMAGGANITWGDGCWSDLQVNLQTFACNNNSTSLRFRMGVSAMIDTDMPDFLGVGIYLEGKTSVATMPDWWMLDSGQCRNQTANPSFTEAFAGTLTNCADLFGGGGGGGVGAYIDYLTPASGYDANRAQLNAAWSVPDPMDFPPAQEFLIGEFIINAYKTLGATACAGCATPMTWGYHHVLVSGNSGDVYLGDPIATSPAGGNSCLYWQAQVVPCAAPVPAKNTTWGQVKSLYR